MSRPIFRGSKSPIIPAGMVFIDESGREWRRSARCQDSDPNGLGWLELEISLPSGERMSLPDVVSRYGFKGSEWYLKVRMETT